MLKEIKNERDVITNVDLFNEIILKVKESGNGRMTLLIIVWLVLMTKQVYMIMRLNLVLF